MDPLILKKLAHLALNRGDGPRCRHAAAVVYKGKVMACATNSWKTHTIQLQYGRNRQDSGDNGDRKPTPQHKTKAIYLHAEVAAIIRASTMLTEAKLRRASLYVVRVGNEGQILGSAPCSGCMSFIEASGIKSVVHT